MNYGSLRITLPGGQTRDYLVEQASIGAGRAEDNELIIDDNSLSRRHARLTFETGHLLVEDLGSANGTFVGSQWVAANTPTLVPENAVVRLGDVELRFSPAVQPQPTQPAPAPQGGEQPTMMTAADDTEAAVPRFGALRIRMPDGAQRDFALEVPNLSVGRAPENQLVLDDISVSRRHARLTVEFSRLMVEDLGSANGTFVGGQRLNPNTPSQVSEGQPLKLGDVELRFLPPTPQTVIKNMGGAGSDATMAVREPAAAAGPPFTVALAGPTQPVAPGSETTASLTIYNRGTVVDEFLVRVSGVPAEWVRLSTDRVPLLPNAQEKVNLSFQPPRRAEAVAADHRFTISVISREHHTGLNVQGTLRVLPYQGFTLTLQPVRGERDFQLVALNQGNAPANLALAGSDEGQSLLYHFAQPAISVAPGQTVIVGLSVTPKAPPRIGTRETRVFSVVAQPLEAAGGPEARVSGQLIIRPPIPLWLIPLAVILALCLCISSAFAYVQLCPANFPSAPFCPAAAMPVINLFTATPSEINQGDTVVIAWDVSNAETVELLSPTVAPISLDASGLRAFNPVANTTFILRATNFAGSIEQLITITVRGSPPSIEAFTATPGVLTPGQTDRIVLSWATINAITVTIEGVPGQNFPATGSVEVPAPSANTTYTLIAANDTDSARQAVTVVISLVECSVTGVVPPDKLNMRAGPGGGFAVVVQLDNGTRVDPLGRTSTGDWLKVRAAGREGWVATNFITCTGATDPTTFPTVEPGQIPTLAPTATNTAIPPSATVPPVINTPTPTPTPTATPTPVFASGGLVTYREVAGGLTSIYLQNATGGRITLVFNKDDANVLDYTPNNGGRFAIWALEGGQQKVFIIDRNGQLVGGPITGGWTEITDGDWSYDGQRLVLEAVTGGSPTYYFYDGSGNALGQPALP